MSNPESEKLAEEMQKMQRELEAAFEDFTASFGEQAIDMAISLTEAADKQLHQIKQWLESEKKRQSASPAATRPSRSTPPKPFDYPTLETMTDSAVRGLVEASDMTDIALVFSDLTTRQKEVFLSNLTRAETTEFQVLLARVSAGRTPELIAGAKDRLAKTFARLNGTSV